MQQSDWKQAVEAWQQLPSHEKARRRWQRIPRNVAQSMSFAGEPVSLTSLEALHATQPLPYAEDRDEVVREQTDQAGPLEA